VTHSRSICHAKLVAVKSNLAWARVSGLKDDVETVRRLYKADILDDIVMLYTDQCLCLARSVWGKASYMQILQKVDFGLGEVSIWAQASLLGLTR
jgi:hypothetical protein